MRVLLLSKKYPLLPSVVAFILGALLILGIQQVFADTTIYYACVKTNGGTIRVVAQGATCTNSETLISWNQQGPQGIQGVPGPSGAPGPTGIPGSGGNGPFSNYVCIGCKYSVLNDGHSTANGFGNLITGKDFSNAFIPQAGFNYGNVTNTVFTSATISESSFYYTNASGAKFNNAKMQGVDFTGAILSGADFTNTDLSPFTLQDPPYPTPSQTNIYTYTNFTNADLTGAIGMASANVTGVIWSNTTCPDGSNSDSNGNTCLGHF